jgi:hypothetical protein
MFPIIPTWISASATPRPSPGTTRRRCARFARLSTIARMLVSAVACLDGHHLRRSLSLQIGRLIRKSSQQIAVASDIPARHRHRLMPELIPDQKRQVVVAVGHASLIETCKLNDVDPYAYLESACTMGLEGIISKRLDRPHRSGRSSGWLKSLCWISDPFVINRYAPSRAANEILGSLVLGFYEGGSLIHAGRVGTGF